MVGISQTQEEGRGGMMKQAWHSSAHALQLQPKPTLPWPCFPAGSFAGPP